MKHWKTTLFGVIAALPQIVNALAPIIPPKYANAATAISAAIALAFAADAQKDSKDGS